jgi:Helix-turn-helix family
VIDAGAVSQRARALAAAIEPFVGQVYFSPECHAEYQALGFGGSPATLAGGVAAPDGPAYFCSRGSALGQPSGELVSAAFAVFNPAVVVPAVDHGWTLCDGPTIAAARTRGAIAQLARILGPEPDGVDRAVALLSRATDPLRPEGRPLYAGLRSQPVPDDALGAAWRLADLLREYRGDAHTAAWTTAGLDATEIGLLTELYWGLPMRTYVRTRAWSAADLDAAQDRLVGRGLLDGDGFSPAGRDAREAIERVTDAQCRPVVEALGDDLDELVDLLCGWSGEVRAGAGYLQSGPPDLARRAAR